VLINREEKRKKGINWLHLKTLMMNLFYGMSLGLNKSSIG